MELHEILSERRRQIGMSMEVLVEKSGVAKGTVTKIMAGITRNPQIESLKAITYALGLRLEDLDDHGSNSPSEEALAFARRYDALDYYGRQAVKAIMEIEYERCANPLSKLDARQKEIIDRRIAEDDATASGEA